MNTLKEYLDKLRAIADASAPDLDFRKSLNGLPTHVREQREKVRRKSLARFMDHHVCTGTFNGSPVWRRLPSFYASTKPASYFKKANVPGGERRRASR